MKSPQNEESQKYWEAFRACAEENRVHPDRSSFYVKWAQAFVRFLPEKRLQDRSGKDIQAFLADLAQRQGVADWQVRQAKHALKILYEMFLPHYASEKTLHLSPNGRETIYKKSEFRDSVLPGEVERQFSSLVETLKTEIRTRHYSYRTETSYLDWMRRFIAFHDYTVPRGPDSAAKVRTYLEYLAVEREVSASTQNQALNAVVFFYKNVLREPIGEMDEFTRAKRPRRLPEVLTRTEIEGLLSAMNGLTGLMAGVMYGSGCLYHHDLHPRIKQVGLFGKKSSRSLVDELAKSKIYSLSSGDG